MIKIKKRGNMMYTQPTALRSVLDPKYLEYCLSEHYDIGEWDECLYWLRGLNDTYRVRTSNGFYIKDYRYCSASIDPRNTHIGMQCLTSIFLKLSLRIDIV